MKAHICSLCGSRAGRLMRRHQYNEREDLEFSAAQVAEHNDPVWKNLLEVIGKTGTRPSH